MRRHVFSSLSSFFVAAGVAGFAACAAPTDDTSRESVDIGSVAEAVAAEQSGKVEYAFRHYADANIARAQFATPMWNGGCSSTMIGPNILLTAAHCGPAEAATDQNGTAKFITYRGSETEQNTESFTCRRLIHGWPRHDLAVHYCDANATGVSPGDKYGYLDMETRAPVVGDEVYSIWWNPVVAGATGNQSVPLYSAGQVTSTTSTIWSGTTITSGPAAGTGPAGKPVGIAMNTWGQPGTSGSSNIDPNTTRILVGPTTLANTNEGPWKAAFSMQTYFGVDLLAPGSYPGANLIENVKASNFPSGSYDFASYVGKVDKNANTVFDVQEDIERQHGENTRATYWLGFDNHRRNALWETAWCLIDYDAKETPIQFSGPGLAMRHRYLNLKPNTNYRVGVKVKTTSAGNGAALTVGFERLEQSAWSVAGLATLPGTTAVRSALLRTDGNPKPFLAIRSTGAFTGSVSEVEVIEDGTTSSFEVADQREGWTTVFQQPANFVPRGVTSETPNAMPDFALAVRNLWGGAIPVSTKSQLFLTGRWNRLCFKARSIDATTASGVARVTSGTTDLLNTTFPLTTSWTSHCYGRMAPTTSDTTLTFSGSGNLATSILIDDVKVDQDPSVIFVPPVGGVLQLAQ